MSAIPTSPALSGAAALELNPLAYRATPRAAAANEAEALKVGRDFEALFLSQMLQPMFDTLGTDPVFGGGYGERMFRSLQVEQFANAMTRSGGIGLAGAIAREMLRMQETANA